MKNIPIVLPVNVSNPRPPPSVADIVFEQPLIVNLQRRYQNGQITPQITPKKRVIAQIHFLDKNCVKKRIFSPPAQNIVKVSPYIFEDIRKVSSTLIHH